MERSKHKAVATRSNLEASIFGASDGLTSTIAIIVAQLIAGNKHSLLAGGFAIALAAGVGMGASEWLSDSTKSIRKALVMCLATLFASTVPVLPFLVLWHLTGIVACLILSLLLALAIAFLRGKLAKESYTRSFATTFGILIIVSVLVSIPSILVGT